MKNTILLGCVLVFGALAQGKTITVEVPDNLFGSNTKINGNFDGSISVSNPQVFYNGRYTPLAYKHETGRGICFLLNKSYVNMTVSGGGSWTNVVSISATGGIDGVYTSDSVAEAIICK